MKQNISPLTTLRRGCGNLFNAVEIYWCRGLQKIIAVVTVLGTITKSVVLAECDCADAVLCVIEPAFQAGEMKNLFFQLDQDTQPLPLLEVQEFPVTMAAIVSEFEVFAGNTLAVDSVLATLYRGMLKVVEKHTEVSQELIGEVRQLLVPFVQGIARSTRRIVSAEEVVTELETAGLSTLAAELGKDTTAAEVQQLVGRLALAALEKFCGRANGGRGSEPRRDGQGDERLDPHADGSDSKSV